MKRLLAGLVTVVLAGPFVWARVAVAASSPDPITFAAPWQQESLSAAFKFQNATFPILAHGYLLSFARIITPERKDDIFLTSLVTGTTVTLPYGIDQATSIHLDAGTVSHQDNITLTGSFILSQEAADRHNFRRDPSAVAASDHGPAVTNFFTTLDLQGRVLHFAQLGDYTPERVCSAPDGTIWILGQNMTIEGRPPAADAASQHYFLLRHFTPEGTLIGSYLDRATLGAQIVPKFRSGHKASSAAFLACGDKSVVAYTARATGGFLWTEVDYNSGLSLSYIIRQETGVAITSFALLSEHKAVASFSETLPNGQKGFTNPVGLFTLEPTASSRTWIPISRTTATSSFSFVLGVDNPNVLVLEGDIAPSKSPLVYWTAIQ